MGKGKVQKKVQKIIYKDVKKWVKKLVKKLTENNGRKDENLLAKVVQTLPK